MSESENIIIKLDEKLTIHYAEESKTIFMDVLSNDSGVDVDFSNVEGIDISGLQLLISLYKEATLLGRDIDFVGEFSSSFKEELSSLTFSSESISESRALLEYIKGIV